MRGLLTLFFVFVFSFGFGQEVVDLSTWQQKGNTVDGTWTYNSVNNTLTQSTNSNSGPALYVSDENFINKTISGEIYVNTTSDDDMIGFVLGFEEPNVSPSNHYKFLLVDWKQGYQNESGYGEAKPEIRLIYYDVTSDDIKDPSDSYVIFWQTPPETATWGVIDTYQPSSTFPDVNSSGGWEELRTIEFKAVYTEDNIKVFFDFGDGGFTKVFDVNASSVPYFDSFPTGKFGFYNYSQQGVVYKNFTAPNGDIEIVDAGGGMQGVDWEKSGNTFIPLSNNAQINASEIESLLNAGTNVTVSASNTLTVSGDIIKTTSNTASLTLKSEGSISINSASITTNGGNVHLWSDSNGSSSGRIGILNGEITTAGGNITLSGGTDGTGYAVGNDNSIPNIPLHRGIWISGSTLNANGTSSGGNIQINGKGYPTEINSDYNIGADFVFNTELKTNFNGQINIKGIGGPHNSDGHGAGVNFFTQNSVHTEDGSISITGTAGGGLSTSARLDAGINFDGGGSFDAKIYSTSGDITLKGYKSSLSNSYGIMNGIDNIPTYIGTDGTNKTSGDIYLKSDNFDFQDAFHTIETTGGLFVTPESPSFSTALNSSDIYLSDSLTELTIGKSTNTANITLDTATTIDGPISVYGGDIAVNQNLTSTASDADILFKGSGSITVAANKSITTNGGDIVFWANSDGGASDGSVLLRSLSSIRTSGGNLWMGGGSGTTTWNGLTVGDGYAVAGTVITPSSGGNTFTAGLYFERATITTNGGHVYAKGDAGSLYGGIVSYGTSDITSDTGTINLEGVVSGTTNSSGILFGNHDVRLTGSMSLTSSASGDAITVTGQGKGTGGGIELNGTLTLQSTGSGNIDVNGSGGATGYGIEVGAYYHGVLNAYAASGDITLDGGTNGVRVSAAQSSGSTTGPSRTNLGSGGSVVSSSSDIYVIGDVFSVATTNGFTANATGTATIAPFGNSFTSALSFPISNVNLGASLTGLTLGKETNTANITITAAQTIDGPISIYGGDIAINENLNTTGGGADGDILLKGSGNIIQTDSKSITTSGGDVTLWTNSDDETTNGGYIYLQDNTTIDSRTSSDRTANDGTANDISGGAITLGGGAGTTVPTGYALNNANSLRGGINLGTESGGQRHNSNITLISGGGNLTLKGKQTSLFNGDAAGINAYEGFILDAGKTGNITLEGDVSSAGASYSDGINFGNYATTAGGTASYIKTVDGNITFIGSASDAITQSRGLTLAGGGVGLFIQSTGTGSISLSGTPGGTGVQYNILLVGANILANSGKIDLVGGSTGKIFNEYFGSTIGYKPDTDILSSTSDITVTGDDFDLSSGFNFNTAGALSIKSFGSSFTDEFNTSQLTYSSDLSGLTIGKTTNTANVTISSATTIAGPISVYGGTIAINANLNTTGGSTAGDVLLKASGNITQGNSVDITTDRGDVILWSDSDASGTTSSAGGTIALLDGSSINTSGGNITLAGGADTNTDGIPDGYAIGAYNMQARGATNATAGLSLDNATLDAGTGNVILRGQGIGDRVNFQIGTRLYGGSITAKDVTVNAIGSTRGSSSSSWGLSLEGFSILGSGDISLNGIGGKAGTSNSDSNQAGVEIGPALDNAAKHSQVKATGDGTILIKGTGGSGALSTSNNLNATGIRIISGQTNPINSEDGSITLEGTSGYNGGGPGILIQSPVSSTNGAITLKALQSTAGTTGLNGNIEIQSTVTTGTNLIIESLGAVTQTAAITADGLGLQGTGTFTLQNTANNVAKIAGGTSGVRLGNIAYRDANTLEIGSVNPTGLFSSGTILVETENGDLTLSESINTTSSSDDAIILNAGRASSAVTASGGDIIVNGSPTLTYGSSGRAKLFSGTEVGSTGLTTLAGGSSNVRTGFDEVSQPNDLADDNAYAIYRVNPGQGDLTIVASGGDAENSTWIFDSGTRVLTTISSPVNVNASVVEGYLSAGVLTIEAANITVDADVTSTTANSFVLKSTGTITVNKDHTIQTNAGDIVFWSNSADGNTSGYILMDDGVTLNSINGSISSGLSGGGDIILAGGSSVDADGYPNGYAQSSTKYGVSLNTTQSDNKLFSAYSGGGDIRIYGKSTSPSTADPWDRIGVLTRGDLLLNSGKGQIDILGVSENFYGINISYPSTNTASGPVLEILSAAPTGTAISIAGTSETTSYGVVFNYNNPKEILATAGGDISITGVTTGGTYGIFHSNTDVLATDGTITIDGGAGIRVINNYTYISDLGYVSGHSSNGSSAADVVVITDQLKLDDPLKVSTSGKYTLKPSSNSFSSAITYPISKLTLTDLTGLTIGKATNTANVTVGSATTIAGPISVYGGTIAINANLNTTGGSTAGDVLLKASGNITQGNSVDITTDGGDVIYWADSDEDNNGYISFGSSGGQDIVTNGGDVYLAGGAGTTVPTGYAHGNTAARGVGLPMGTTRGLINTSNGGETAGDIIIRGKSTGNFDGIYFENFQLFGHDLTLDGETGNAANYGVRLGSTNVYNDIPGGNKSQVIDADNDLTITAVNTAASYAGNALRTGVNPRLYADGNFTLNSSGDLSYTSNQSFININPSKILSVNFDGTATFTTSLGDPNAESQGALVIQSNQQNSFTSAFDSSNWTFNNNLARLTIGKSTNTGNITIGSATTIEGPITIYGGAVSVNAPLTATDDTISITSSTSLTDGASGYLVASGLALKGSGSVTLDNALNDVATIATGSDDDSAIGALNFTNKEALTVGAVNPTGISSTGPITIKTLTGDLTISEDITTTNSSSDAIRLYADVNKSAGDATGGNIKISGTPAISTGSGGTAKLYSGSAENSTDLSALVDAANLRYNVDATTTSFDPAISSGNYVLYRERAVNDNANLSSLTTSSGTLTPVFDSATTSYSVVLASGTTSVNFTPTTEDAGATVTINETAHTSGTSYTASGLKAYQEYSIEVTASDETTTKTYRLKVYVTQATVPAPVGLWRNLFAGENFDPNDDQQATAETDLVGNATDAMMQAQQATITFDDNTTDKVYYFRVRLGNENAPKTSFYYGMDIDGDYAVDFVIEANLKDQTPYVAYHAHDSSKDGSGPSQTAWENSKNNTNIERELTTRDARIVSYATVGQSTTNVDIDGPVGGQNNGDDTWLEFAFTEASFKSWTTDYLGTELSGGDVDGLVAFTSTSQTANGDIGGINDKTADLTLTWRELGNFIESNLDEVTTYSLFTPTVVSQTSSDETPTVTGTWGGSNEGDDTLAVTVNGVTYTVGNGLTVEGSSWSLTVSTALTDGTYPVTATVTRASDSSTKTDSTTNELVIQLDNVPPTVTGDAAITINEGTTAVETYTADETVTWSKSGTDADLFTLTDAGVLSFTAAPDYEDAKDADANNTYLVTITATDSFNNVTTTNVVVTVADVDEIAPTITGEATKTVNENTTAVQTFEADETVTWSITGTDASLFTINATTGVLVFNAAPDYELPADGNTDNDYLLTVTATDAAGNTTDKTVTVTVADVDEIAPTITGEATKTINENTTAVQTFEADETVTWSITGTDASLFTINATTGVLVFNAAPDYELPADGNTDNDYLLTVTATDAAGNTTDKTVTVTVADVDEIAPVITGSATKTVNENTTAVETFTADETVTWSITGTDANLFTINATTGVLVFNAAPDYELPADGNTDNDYLLTVTATDAAGNTTDKTVTVTVVDVDEIAPTITGEVTKTVNENTTAVQTFTADETVTWSISGTDASLFTINETTGVLVFNQGPDYENPSDADTNNTYILTITAQDAAGNSSEQVLTVTVLDVAETRDFTLSAVSDLTHPENAVYTGPSFSTSGDNPIGELTYSISGEDAELYTVDASTGSVSLTARDFELPTDGNTNNTYLITVTGTDTDGNTAVESWTITITNVIEDADGDGIEDYFDQCADTPEGESVDANGCSASQKDSDGDGVNDAIDLCPETAPEQRDNVNAQGCALVIGYTTATTATTESGGELIVKVSAVGDIIGSAVKLQTTLSGSAEEGDDYSIPTSKLTIPAGDYTEEQTFDFKVRILEDDYAEASEQIVLKLTGLDLGSYGTQEHTITLTDNDQAGATLTVNDNVTSEDGDTGSFDIVLTSKPLNEVIIALSSSNVLEGSLAVSQVVFTEANWNVPQTITVTGVDDDPAVGDGAVAYQIITGNFTSVDPTYDLLDGTTTDDVAMINENNDPPGFSVKVVSETNKTSEAGATVVVGFKLLSIPQNDHDVVLPIALSDATEGTLSTSSITLTAANWDDYESHTVTITGKDDELLDGPIAYELIPGDPTSDDPEYDALGADAVAKVSLVNLDDEVDTDGDGILDGADNCVNTPNPNQLDTDGDGIGDVCDTDIDGDGTPNEEDAFPTDPDEDTDTDGDGVGDSEDNDADGDGTPDAEDAFPLDPTEDTDTDGDGTGDNSDAFPNDPDESEDLDGDGVGDNADTDTDGDGTPDEEDAFPLDPNEDADTDGDGTGDNADAFPSDPTEDTDTDGDGVGDNTDALPNNGDETTDTDGDGIGDNADTDDDNDGVLDTVDVFPLDPKEAFDADGDGLGDNEDPDDDNDGVEDIYDACPNTVPGTPVDVNGCDLLIIPTEDFTVSATSATCSNTSDGEIIIEALDQTHSYLVTVTGQSQVIALNSTAGYSKTVSGLTKGTYTVCFKAVGDPFFEQCYTVYIDQPEALQVVSSYLEAKQALDLQIDGATEYYVELNGVLQTRRGSRISLALQKGMNRVKIYTDLDCQGVIEEEVFVSEELEYAPNPVVDNLNLYVGGTDTEVSLTITDLNGVVIERRTVRVPASRIYSMSMTRYREGMYLLHAKSATLDKQIKLIKR